MIALADLEPLAIDLLLLGAILIVFVADLVIGSKRALGYLTVALLVGAFAASFFLDTEGDALSGAYRGGPWPLFLKRIFLGAGALACLGGIEHLARRETHRQGEYYVLILFSLLGMTLLPGARDLILLFVCFELMGIPLYVLAAYAKTDDPLGDGKITSEASLKLYLVGVVSTAIALFGVSLVVGLAGSTSVAEIAQARSSPLLSAGVAMIIGGMAFKIGAVPFHMWVPDTYQGASTPFVAFLSVAPKVAGFAALATLLLTALALQRDVWLPMIVTLSVVTMLVGNLMAIAQTNVKRLLAFSGVAHIGYMLMAFAAGDVLGLAMLLFYAAGYAVTNVGAFLVIEAVAARGGDDTVESFAGLARRSPGMGLAMLLFLLSLAGIPFVVGFWAKLYVFMAVWRAGFPLLVLLGAVLAVVALFYYLRVARAMYMVAPTDTKPIRPGLALGVAIGLCLLGVVAMGAFPGPIVERAIEAARPFFG